MGLETGSFISDLVSSNPVGATDVKAQGDDHIRLIKTVVKATLPQGDRAIRTNEIGGVYQSKTANFTIDATHAGAFINCTANTFTVSLTAVATLAANFGFRLRNSGSGVITIDPNAAELINGGATYDVAPGESVMVTCDGSAWHALSMGIAGNRANTFTALQTIQLTTVGDPASELISTDAGAAEGPFYSSYRNSASPAATDALGGVKIFGRDSASNKQLYAAFCAFIRDATSGSEDGEAQIRATIAGADSIIARLGASAHIGGAVVGGMNLSEYQQNGQLFLPRGYIDGLILSNDATDASNDLDIAVGCAVDGGGTQMMVLASAIVKRLDAAWAVGTNQGGLDTGAEASSTWYHVWLIRRPDTGVVDVLFSTSPTAPTMPANYTQKRLIGAFYNTSGSIIRPFIQRRNTFLWNDLSSGSHDFGGANSLGTTPTNFVVSVPTGRRVLAKLRAGVTNGEVNDAMFYCPDTADPVPSPTAFPLSNTRSNASMFFVNDFEIWTNTSAEIRAVARVANLDILGYAFGWIDPRGQDA